MGDLLSISVVVTNWKRQKFIPEIVEQLASQSYPKDKYDVIIVDDNTPEKEEVYQAVKNLVFKHDDMRFRLFETHKQVTRNPALRYNIGIRNSSNQIVILNESDILMQGEYLQRVNSNHQQQPKIFLSPIVIKLNSDGSTFVEAGRGPLVDLGGSVRREYISQVGGCDETYVGWGGLENKLTSRLSTVGVKCHKDPELKVLHKAFVGIPFPQDHADYAGAYNINTGRTREEWGTLDTLEEVKF